MGQAFAGVGYHRLWNVMIETLSTELMSKKRHRLSEEVYVCSLLGHVDGGRAEHNSQDICPT